ncbi:MAG: VCBS repeat-containing protein, partial [Bacteroidota bacterium]
GNFTSATSAIPKITSSGMAVLAEDIDQDGDLDLLVGGRLVPGKYPSPPRSYILENQQGIFKDITEKVAPALKNIGMITELSFSDYDGDGDKDILAVGEWMSISFLENEEGIFNKLQELPNSSGWWFSISEGDIDKDGDIDYVVGNLGMNNKYHPSLEKPLHIYYKDFDQNGSGDIALSKKDNNTLFPIRGRECSSQQIPSIKDKFPDYKSFAVAPMDEIYGAENLDHALHYEATEFRNILLINQGEGQFEQKPLPTAAQLSPIMGSEILDVNKDGYPDIIAAGNFYPAETETIRYDAGSGLLLLGNGSATFSPLPSEESGLMLSADVRDLKLIQLANDKIGILISSNKGELRLLVKN